MQKPTINFVSDIPNDVPELANYASTIFLFRCSANLYYGDSYQFSAYAIRSDDDVTRNSAVTISKPFTAFDGLISPN